MTATTTETRALDELCVNTIRTLSMDAVEKANSGHPGTPMALAPLAYRLYTTLMRHDPGDPAWIDRDRFVLSAGHACMVQYASFHLSGDALTVDDLAQFRQVENPNRASRAWCHRRRRDQHRPPRPGLRQRRRYGHGRAHACGPVQPPRPRSGRPSARGSSAATAT